MRGARNWILTAAAIGVLGGAGLVGVGLRGGVASGSTSPPLAPAADDTRTPALAPTGPRPAELAAKERARRVTALDAALKKYAATVPEFSVAVLDKKTGQRYSYRGAKTFETASVVKVQVLACLLLSAQNKHRELTSTEVALAKRMIRLSDNDATTSLFNRLGGASGVQGCDRRLGLTHTRVNTAWGLTRTTVDDQATLLAQLVAERGPLDEDSREFADTLMSTVDDEQDWGVPVVAGAGERFTVKNGWLLRPAEGNRWIINSMGRITGGNTDISIAVLSHHHKSMPAGIAVVEKVAKLTRQYLRY